MNINWKTRLTHKTFWISIASAIILLSQQLGLEIFPSNAMEIVNTILLIFTIMGVVVDPTTSGISDSQLVLNRDKK